MIDNGLNTSTGILGGVAAILLSNFRGVASKRPCRLTIATWPDVEVFSGPRPALSTACRTHDADGVHGDIQTTQQLLAQAVERLDHITGVQQQPANVQASRVAPNPPIHSTASSGQGSARSGPENVSRPSGSGHTYPYNPIFGPAQERLRTFQSPETWLSAFLSASQP